jgi:GNAT superfamily N-acetyltransferase
LTISDAELRERQARSQRALYETIAPTTPRGHVIEFDGAVLASVVPVVPHRSLPNAVVYDDPSGVEPVLGELAAVYEAAGVAAWTVWARPGDDQLGKALEAAGHRIDGTPELMGAAIGECDLEPRTPLAIDSGSWAEVAACNDVAYGYDSPTFGPLVGGLGDRVRRYVGRGEAGEPLGCAVAAHIQGDCYITFVATSPNARGRGVASDLMRAALREGLEEGCVTTTLEASAMGRSAYERLGYRPLGALHMWERRAT